MKDGVRRPILSLSVGLIVVLAACGSDDGVDTTSAVGGDETSTTAAATTTAAGDDTTTSTETPTTTAAEEMMDGVHAADSALGTILVDGEGFTVYAFTVDGEGESACYDACAQMWPPLRADTQFASDLDASLFGSITRTDGGDQLTANGHPLYRYAPDASPGDTTGQGINDVWFVVDPGGNLIGPPEAADSEDIIIDYGY
jgi:predicted lipoprotein with Yx(FWY)xxD motif